MCTLIIPYGKQTVTHWNLCSTVKMDMSVEVKVHPPNCFSIEDNAFEKYQTIYEKKQETSGNNHFKDQETSGNNFHSSY